MTTLPHNPDTLKNMPKITRRDAIKKGINVAAGALGTHAGINITPPKAELAGSNTTQEQSSSLSETVTKYKEYLQNYINGVSKRTDMICERYNIQNNDNGTPASVADIYNEQDFYISHQSSEWIADELTESISKKMHQAEQILRNVDSLISLNKRLFEEINTCPQGDINCILANSGSTINITKRFVIAGTLQKFDTITSDWDNVKEQIKNAYLNINRNDPTNFPQEATELIQKIGKFEQILDKITVDIIPIIQAINSAAENVLTAGKNIKE